MIFRTLLCALLFPVAAFAADWKLNRVDGRDYVSLEEVSRFYGLSAAADEATPAAAGGGSIVPVSYRSGEEQQAEIVLKRNSREAVINGVIQWLAFPVREVDGQLQLSRLDLAKTIEPMLRPQRIANLRPVETVVLDAGHGGHDRGATNRFGQEKTYTLDICRRVGALLEAKGVNVVYTRESDVFIPLEKRPKVANGLPNSIFVSIHFNSASTNASGVEVFSLTPRGAPSTGEQNVTLRSFRDEPGNSVDVPSAALAASVHHAMLGKLGEGEPDRGVKKARFAVLRHATVPAILVEGGFLSNGEQAQRIHTEEWRDRLAKAIARGILGYKGLSELRRPPELVADYRKEAAQPGSQAVHKEPEPPKPGG